MDVLVTRNGATQEVEIKGRIDPSLVIEIARWAFGTDDHVTVADPKTGETYQVRNGQARRTAKARYTKRERIQWPE